MAIEEAVKVMPEEVEAQQQTDMEVEEPQGEEWISVEGMDDAVKKKSAQSDKRCKSTKNSQKRVVLSAPSRV